MALQTRDQRLATDVFGRVSAFDQRYPKATSEKERKAYGSMAHRLPVLVRTAGLAQALAFVEAKGGKEGQDGQPRQRAYRQLLTDLGATVGQPKLADAARDADFLRYLHLNQQVIDALIWYKRYAESVMGVVQGEEEGEA